MKKLIIILMTVVLLVPLSCLSVSAEEDDPDYDVSAIYDSLSDEARQHMIDLGADGADAYALDKLSLSDALDEIGKIASENISAPLRGLITVIALLLLCSLLSAYQSSLSGDIRDTLNVAAALGVACVLASPAVAVIGEASQVIDCASRLMIAFVPIMTVLMAGSGQAVGASSYYAAVLAAGEGVNALASRVVIPFMNMFLALGLVSNISPDIRLGGFSAMFAKTARWVLGFMMSVFTAVLSVRQAISGALDRVSDRAVRFALGSFVPVVGGALSEAYLTVRGSVNLLKSGVGIFVVIALLITFLPLLLRVALWLVALWVGKSVAEVLGLSQCAGLLDGVGMVLSTLLAVILCVAAVYVICAALALVMGGGAL